MSAADGKQSLIQDIAKLRRDQPRNQLTARICDALEEALRARDVTPAAPATPLTSHPSTIQPPVTSRAKCPECEARRQAAAARTSKWRRQAKQPAGASL
jgi:hypothetical protein